MVYRFRMISGEVEGFAREFDILGTQTFYDLHLTIQKNLVYDSSQIASFFLTDATWNKVKEFTLFDLDNDDTFVAPMDVATIEEFVKDPKQRLLYTFDMFNDRNFFIELVAKVKDSESKKLPACIFEKGEAPVQIKLDADTSSDLFREAMSDFEEFNNLAEGEVEE